MVNPFKILVVEFKVNSKGRHTGTFVFNEIKYLVREDSLKAFKTACETIVVQVPRNGTALGFREAK